MCEAELIGALEKARAEGRVNLHRRVHDGACDFVYMESKGARRSGHLLMHSRFPLCPSVTPVVKDAFSFHCGKGALTTEDTEIHRDTQRKTDYTFDHSSARGSSGFSFASSRRSSFVRSSLGMGT